MVTASAIVALYLPYKYQGAKISQRCDTMRLVLSRRGKMLMAVASHALKRRDEALHGLKRIHCYSMGLHLWHHKCSFTKPGNNPKVVIFCSPQPCCLASC